MVTIYHNPKCSKSRQALQLLSEADVEVTVVDYLNESLDEVALKTLLTQLKMRPAQLIRRGEKLFKELKLAEKLEDDQALIAAMVEHPILIERPIAVAGDKAVLGRPPENVLTIL